MTEPEQDPRRELRTSVGLFFATLISVFFTYGWTWSGGDPLSDPQVARDSASFAIALMSILLAHELGHYIVARRHGFALTLPYFIPFPAAFGTFGAIIRLKSLPRSRTALLEMGAAGPIAGAVVAILVMAIGLPGTGPAPEMSLPLVTSPPEPGLFDGLFASLDALLSAPWLAPVMDRIAPPVPVGHVPVLIFANPPVMDLLGTLLLGAPPGRFDTLTPLALAGWVGCLLTAINLVPIGQLDGGHVLTGLFPRLAPRLGRVLLGVAVLGGVLWTGWIFWALMLFFLGAWRNLEVPEHPGLSARARAVALVVVLVFGLTFMPAPVQMDSLPAVPAPVGP